MMTASKFDSLLSVLSIRNYNPEGYDINVKSKINKLYELFNKIKPLSDDEYKVLYFSVERGNIEEYCNYAIEVEEEISDYKEFIDMFNEDYPEEVNWYTLTSTRYENYRMLSINSKTIIYADMDSENICISNYQLQELLDFIIVKVTECIKKLEDGTYNDYISKNYSYRNRFGVVKRSKYWEIYPNAKNNLLSQISQEEMDYFIKNASEKTDNRIKNMTSAKYFECVGLAYKNLNYEIGDLTDKELYLKYADGRDEGLSKIDKESSEQFDNWYNDDSKFSGHPWEIVRGHSFARVNLVIRHDDNGYYLTLDGSIVLRKIEIAKISNILNENNIPIQIYNVDMIKNAFKGLDYIGIVPNEIIPIQCGGYFSEYKPTEFIHMEDNKIFNHVKWESLEIIELKK